VNSRPQLATEEKALPKHKGTLSWAVLCITLLGLVATLGLGTWQLRRAAYKVALASQIESKNQLAAIENIAQTTIGLIDQTRPHSDNPWINRRVDVKGTWLAEHTVFLDNRFMANRAGFYVVTPLQQEGSNAVVWVQRGWVPRNVQDRTRLPDVPTPAGTVQVQGRVAAAVSRAYELGEAQNQLADALHNASQAHAPSAGSSAPASARASRIWQNIPTVNFGPQAQLMPVAILQTATPNAPQDGLLRDWPQADVGIAKHYGYAFQWFALCGLIIALYVWFQILAPRRKST
jgi:surfeit locus 1 family protein